MQMHDIVGLLVLAIAFGLAGLALGLYRGCTRYIQMLENMVDHGSTGAAPAGRTIFPETAEMRIEKSAAQVEQEYAKETIRTGMAHLKALYVSEGAEVPSDKELEAEVKEMLGRSGTPEAGVHV